MRFAIALVAALVFVGSAGAQDYPNRTVKIVVSAPPGGGPDIAARMIADKLHAMWGQPVIVENRPGNGGNTGAEVVALAPPDGYTILAAQPTPLTTSVHLYKKLNFDPLAFEPIAIMMSFPNLLVVRPDFPANTTQELIAYAKAHPNGITYASQGPGTTPHLTGEWLARATGTQLVHVPYRGTAQAMNDLIASHVDMMFLEMSVAYELIAGHRVKVLGVAAKERVAALPDVPTLEEAGLKDFVSYVWNALAAPPKTPKPVIAKFNAAVNEIFHRPDMVEQFARMKMHAIGGTPGQMAEFLAAERKRWGEVIEAAHVTVNQ